MAMPTQVIINKIVTLLAGDTGTFASATLGVKVHLAIAAFVPSPSLLIGGLTEATFAGYAALVAGVNAQLTFNDPISGAQMMELIAPASGWHWATTTAVGLPQTVYGYYVTDNGSATLYASALFPTPFILNAAGQGIDIGTIRFQFSLIPMT